MGGHSTDATINILVAFHFEEGNVCFKTIFVVCELVADYRRFDNLVLIFMLLLPVHFCHSLIDYDLKIGLRYSNFETYKK